jgi:hypothetical protein
MMPTPTERSAAFTRAKETILDAGLSREVAEIIRAGLTARGLSEDALWDRFLPRLASGIPTEAPVPDRHGVELVRLSMIKRERIEWLWNARVPRRKITVLDGDPGLGKSCALLDLAARVTRGRAMPDEPEETLHEPGNVLVLSAEDGAADTIRPRFDEARGDPERLFVLTSIKRPDGTRDLLSLSEDMAALEEAAASIGATLIIIDPFTAYVGKANTWKDQEIRRVLAGLADLAGRTGAAVVLLRHLNKTKSENPLYRGGGSIGIVGAARVGLLVEKDPDQDGRRLLATTKSNISKSAPTLAYRVVPSPHDADIPVIEWEPGSDPRSAEEILAAAGQTLEERSAVGDARGFLRQFLAEGPRPSSDVIAEAKARGIAERTLRRAQREIACAEKSSLAGGWVWRLR